MTTDEFLGAMGVVIGSYEALGVYGKTTMQHSVGRREQKLLRLHSEI